MAERAQPGIGRVAAPRGGSAWCRPLALPSWTDRSLLALAMVALAFAVFPTGLDWDPNRNPNMLEGSWVRRVQWVSVFAWALWHARRLDVRPLFVFVWINPFVGLLAGYIVLSALWSDFPGVVLRQSVQVVGVWLLALVLAAHWSERFATWSWWVLTFLQTLLVASVVLVVVNPGIAVETEVGIAGAWRGVAEQKNLLGIVCGISLLLWTVAWTHLRQPAWWSIAGLGLIVLCLVQSRSSTSLFFGVTSSALYLLLYKDHAKATAFVLRVVLLLTAVLAAFSWGFFLVNDRLPDNEDLLGPISALFGKGTDLTGRDDIWFLMRQTIAEHPWLGVGYASFWLGVGGPSQFISDALQWNVPSAHNGYLDVANELGFIGLGLMLLMLGVHLKHIVVLFGRRRAEAAFHFCLLYIFIVSNFTESQALRVTSFLQLMLLMSMAMVHMATFRERMAAVRRG